MASSLDGLSVPSPPALAITRCRFSWPNPLYREDLTLKRDRFPDHRILAPSTQTISQR